ncbi:MAG: hypothetical protein H6566_26720 [Lewinellaceae bacterium]|nr:hypothetical protein [Lewinellaceae bacterium]
MKTQLLLLFLLSTIALFAQNITLPVNWNPGDQWHYELLWTIDAPGLRKKDTPPTTVIAYPVFKVMEAGKEGFTLSVSCDSARVLEGPTGRNGDGLLLPYRLEYIFRTDRAGRFAGIQNLASISEQMLQALANSSFSDDPPRMLKEFQRFPHWEEAYFLREYDFIFDAYGHGLKPGEEASIPAEGKRFYHLTNTVPMDITVFDSIIGAPTVMDRAMTLTREGQAIKILARGAYTQPPFENKQEGFSLRYEEKKGYYRATGIYDEQTGHFLEGELVFGTTGGDGMFIGKSGESDLPEQLIEERRTFKSITPIAMEAAVKPADPPGIMLPLFPKYEEVVRYFYQQYKGSAVPNFKLSKHPDGYRITRLFDNGQAMFEPEPIWGPAGGWQAVANFNLPEPVEPGAPDRVVEVYNPYQWQDYADWHLRKNGYSQRECDRQPYFGYPGFYYDVIPLLEPHYEALSNEQLHTLARCYSFAASGLLHNNSGFADSTRMFSLPPGQNALSPGQLAAYKAAHQKAVNAYALLAQRNPAFPTPVGTVRTKYANEAIDGFLTLLYFQNEKEARTLLPSGLYDAHLLQTASNMLESCPKDAVLITYGDTDTYPLLFVQATQKLRPDVTVANVSLLKTPRYYQYLTEGALGAKPLKTLLPERFFREIILLGRTNDVNRDLEKPQDAVAFLTLLGQGNYTNSSQGYQVAQLPINRLSLPKAPGKASFPGQEPVQAYWTPGSPYLALDAIAILDMVASNAWSRPVCFALTCAPDAYAPWQGHLALEGMVYRVFPNELPRLSWNNYAISEEKSLSLWRQAFSFEEEETPLSEEKIPFFYSQFLAGLNLAKALQQSDRCPDALVIAELLGRHFTDEMRPRNYYWISLAEVLAACGEPGPAERLGLQVWDNFAKKKLSENELQFRQEALMELTRIGNQYSLEKLKSLR